MSALQIPKFSFNNSTIKTDKELEERSVKTTGGNKYLDTGKHTVMIKAVEYAGAAKDSRWGRFKIVYEGTGEKTATEWLNVPFTDVVYKTGAGKDSTFPFMRLQKFMLALGVILKVSNLQEILTEYFSKPDRSLVGQSLVITVGYDKNHVAYRGKNTDGQVQYVLTDKDENTTFGTTFPSRDAALAYAEQNQIPVEEYSKVLTYDAVPGGPKKVTANW